METEHQRETLCKQLGTVDQSILFLVLLVFSILLSLYSVLIQRRGLCDVIVGDAQAAQELPKVFPIKIGAGALVIGALGFFLCLALQTQRTADAGDDCVAKRSAASNVCASILVLAAALLRFQDLNYVERCQSALLAGDDQPA